jgi:hypothetical protein
LGRLEREAPGNPVKAGKKRLDLMNELVGNNSRCGVPVDAGRKYFIPIVYHHEYGDRTKRNSAERGVTLEGLATSRPLLWVSGFAGALDYNPLVRAKIEGEVS